MREIVVLLLALVFLFQGVEIQAQSQKVTDYIEEFQQRPDLFFKDTPQSRQTHYGKIIEGFNSFDPVQSWVLSNNPNPALNFYAHDAGIFAGDVNGDGLNDMIFRTISARDERTSDLESITSKTAVFFGDNRTGTPDQIIYEYLVPVGDLNGNGFADAFARAPESNQFILFTGSSEGYQETGSLFDFNVNEIIAFRDLDGDGYQDVLFYNSLVINNQSQITVFWGADELDNVEEEQYSLSIPVESESIVFNAGNFTFDSKDELIALVSDRDESQTVNVNQTVLRWSFDENRTPGLVQTIDVDPLFSGNASSFNLIPIDVNGNGLKELFIHEFGNQTDKYLFTFDSVTNFLDDEPVLFYDNQAIPVGDLNNNGRYDFIAGDPENSYHPYIAFGPENLEDGLTLDVKIEGDTDENWSWLIPGNSHAGFGDLNGDGIDDVIMGHTQWNENTLGRRYLSGSETGNFESEFVHIPREYAYSQFNSTLDIGDFNNNGYNDLALLSLNQMKIDLYFGGPGSLQKSQTLEFDFSILNMSTGDFNGDGIPDLLIGYNGGNVIDIFYGGETISSDPDIRIDPEDFVIGGNFTAAYFPYNIGDINNSGYDDFAATSMLVSAEDGSGALREVYIFFGGEILSGLPDVTITSTDVTNQAFIGYNLTALGDINGDGINDFAFANPYVTNGNSTFGEVRIYYGNEEGAFDEPDLILYPEYNDGGGVLGFGFGLSSGDFNGDGIMDLAIGSSQFIGNPAVVIYYGGSEISSQPDEKLWIPLDSGLGVSNNSDQYSERILPNLRSVPDLTGNAKDELLVSEGGLGFSLGTNAALFLGESFGGEKIVPSAYLKAPNQATGLGSNYSSAIGDFTQDGSVSAILLQIRDNNDAFQSSRMYEYNLTEIANASRPQVVVTVKDSVGQAGGTIANENDGVNVLIPENALEENTEIEFGTFNIIPDGAEISGLMIYLGPSGLTFNEPVEVTVTYDPDNLPVGITEEELILLRYDDTDMTWEELPTVVNTFEKTATGTTMKFSGFAAGVLSGSVSNEELSLDVPNRFELNQNYPNPFNPATVITYTLPVDAEVTLEVFNMLGQRVSLLVDEHQRAGHHEARFASGNLASGMYLYRLSTPGFVQTRKMLLIK